jgi:hypothetical protein
MERPDANRTRALLVATAENAGSWALARLSHWLLLARARLEALEPRIQAALPPRAQRFGKSMWRRITARFPALAELLSERGAPHPASNGHAAPSHELREQAETQLHAEPAEDLATLIATLRDPSAEVAAVAAIKLGSRREPEAAYALCEALENTDGYFSPLTRVAALQAFTHRLPSAPSTGDVATLTSLVRDIDAEVSMAAIDAVAQRAPASVAIDSLLPIVLDDTGYFLPIVRTAATRALERAGLLSTASA